MNDYEIQRIVNENLGKFKSISEEEWNNKPFEDKWSKKEILGHLCDSAFTNIRRLIVTQYEENQKIVYDQNFWVKAQNYQQIPIWEIINLWHSLNLQMQYIIDNIPENKLASKCITSDFVTLEFIIEDYTAHLQHHLNQIKND